MKHSISFHNLKHKLIESFSQIDEAVICGGANSWQRINDIKSANIPHNIKIVMEFLQNTWPENKGLPCISAFKLPKVVPNSKKYELYVFVKTVGDEYTNDKTGRRRFYLDEIIPFFKKGFYDINETYSIGFATQSTLSNFELGNFKKINIPENNVLAAEIQNTHVTLGLFTHSDKFEKPVLDTMVRFRIEEDKTSQSENNKKIHCILNDANSVLKHVFNSDKLQLGGKDGMSPKAFANSLLTEIHNMNVLPEEEKVYEIIFKNTQYTETFETKVWENINVGSMTFIEFINNSNILVTLSEFIIPWLLINGVKRFNDVDLTSALKPKNSDKVVSVKWPSEHGNEGFDYSIIFADAPKQAVNVSAKAGDGHKVTAIAEISDNADDIIDDKSIRGSIIQLCAKAIAKANLSKVISRQTSVFYCWCMAAALYKKSLTDNDIEQLYTIFKKLSTTNEYPANAKRMTKLSRNDASIIESLTGVNYANIFDNEKESWPYSLTHIFERIVVTALQSEKGNISKDYFYSLKMNQSNKYFQIELFPSKNKCISVKLKSPGTSTNTDSSKKFKFTVLTGSGNILVRKEEYATHGKCINITLGRGSRGQVIGVKLL